MGQLADWKMKTEQTIASCASNPVEADAWIAKVSAAKTWEELQDSGEIKGWQEPVEVVEEKSEVPIPDASK